MRGLGRGFDPLRGEHGVVEGLLLAPGGVLDGAADEPDLRGALTVLAVHQSLAAAT